MGDRELTPARGGRARPGVQPGGTRERVHSRRAVERGAARDGALRRDARVSANVLGEENSGVDRGRARSGPRARDLLER